MNKRILEINDNSKILFRTPVQGVELNLVKDFVGYKKNEFDKNNKDDGIGMAILQEPKIETAYPDIIFVEYKRKNFEKWNEDRKKLNKQDLKILYHLYMKKGLESIQIVRQLGLEYSMLLKSIENLLDANMIERKSGMWQIVNRDDFFAIKKIETVEAKINQWNSALMQAVNNKRFSSECYVLSNTKQDPNEIVKEKFSEFGIGMYQQKNQKFKTIKKAKKNKIPNSYTSLLIEEIIGNVLCY
ncbi:MAG: MarR family winged helix-turn-helix transcriptional regulator [Clostridia bacterium]|nr:MarR family winged helix-turn-helix transcriptional regulator [Clostridia bacterium]